MYVQTQIIGWWSPFRNMYVLIIYLLFYWFHFTSHSKIIHFCNFRNNQNVALHGIESLDSRRPFAASSLPNIDILISFNFYFFIENSLKLPPFMHRIQNGMVGLFMFTSLEIDGKILLLAFSMSKFNLLALNSNFDHDGISEKKNWIAFSLWRAAFFCSIESSMKCMGEWVFIEFYQSAGV